MKHLRSLFCMLGLLALLSACGGGGQVIDETGSGADSSSDGASTIGTGSDSSLDRSGDTSGAGGDSLAGLQTVFYFDYDRSTLTYETRQALDRHAQLLKNSSRAVRLEGHADDRGTREYNLALGERRAKSIADYLVLQGVARGQLETISYGEEKPVSYGQNEQSYKLNRRVELK